MSAPDPSSRPAAFDNLTTLSIFGLAVTGIGAFVIAINAYSEDELTATSLALIASALAFGLLANALLRD